MKANLGKYCAIIKSRFKPHRHWNKISKTWQNSEPLHFIDISQSVGVLADCPAMSFILVVCWQQIETPMQISWVGRSTMSVCDNICEHLLFVKGNVLKWIFSQSASLWTFSKCSTCQPHMLFLQSGDLKIELIVYDGCTTTTTSWFLKCQTSFPFPKGYLGTSLESKKLGINGGYGVLHILGHSLNPIKMHACSIFEKAFPATA